MARVMVGHQMRWFVYTTAVLFFPAACSAQTPVASSLPPSGNDRPSTAATESAGSDLLQAGEYATEKGWSRLQLASQGKGFTFSIESVVSEDGCMLSGEVRDGRGIAADDAGPSTCTVNFAKIEQGIDVSTSTPTECNRFCGYNGNFKATYLKVKDGCSQREIQRTRDDFKQLYDNKDYKSAVAKLSPVLAICLTTLGWEEEGGIRNDLAIAQYKSALYDQCLDTLVQYAEDVKKDDDAVIEGWTPVLADSYLSIIRAARTNIALCSKKSTKK